MPSYSWRDLSRRLKAKGFVADSTLRSDHEVLFLVIHGQETGIRVRLGDHKQDIGKALQSKLARELHMPNAEWLGQFQSCERSLEDYVSHLMANGTLPPDF